MPSAPSRRRAELASECLALCPHPGGVLRPVSAVAGCAGLCLETDLLSHSAVSSGQLVDPKSVTLKMFIGLCCVGDCAHITACWEEPVGGSGGLCACSAPEGAAHDPLELALGLARGEEGETRLAEGPKFGLYLRVGREFWNVWEDVVMHGLLGSGLKVVEQSWGGE